MSEPWPPDQPPAPLDPSGEPHPAATGPADAERAVERQEPARMVPQFGGAVIEPLPAEEAEEGDGYVSAERLLMVGAAGPDVAELAHLLAAAGYRNKIANGEAAPVLDDDVMRLVQAFQDEHDVAPHRPQDGAPPLVPGRDRHSGVVDARTWELLRGERRAVTIRYPQEA